MPSAVTLPALLCAALVQAFAVAAIARVHRLRARHIALAVLVADAASALLLVVFDVILDHLNQGPRPRRMVVIGAHLLLAVSLPWIVWSLALARVARRRMLLVGALLSALTAAGMILPGFWLSSSLRPAEVRRVSVPIENLPAALEGTRIIVVADVHLGDQITLARARARLLPLRDLRADAVIFLGDLSGASASLFAPGAALLDEMAPDVPRFFAIGNHEQWIDGGLAVKEMREHGFTPLVDANQKLRIRGADLWLAGVDFTFSWRGNLTRALEGVPEDVPLVLLSHSPDVVADPLSRRAGLILSGHTHGGQVLLPFVGPLACSSAFGPKYASGLFTLGSTRLFVTRGLGDSFVAFRLYCPPEIAVLELQRA